MAQQSLIDAFDDCLSRMGAGETLDDCLLRYPAYANQLRPLLETSLAVRQIRVPQAELLQDQALVWEQVMNTLPAAVQRRRRGFPLGLLAAAVLLLALIMGTWFFLTRPKGTPEEQVITPAATVTVLPTLNPTTTVTLMPSATTTVTLMPTATTTVTLMPSATPTATITPSPTLTRTPLPTLTATATFAPGCGAPLTEQDATARVMAIYPNTTITAVSQVVKFNNQLVWEVKTSHGIVVNIDVACGVILTIDQPNTNTANTNTNTNDNQSGSPANNNTSGGGSSNDNGGSVNDNTDDHGGNDNGGNDNDDDHGGSSGGSGNSGSGGGGDDDDD